MFKVYLFIFKEIVNLTQLRGLHTELPPTSTTYIYRLMMRGEVYHLDHVPFVFSYY